MSIAEAGRSSATTIFKAVVRIRNGATPVQEIYRNGEAASVDSERARTIQKHRKYNLRLADGGLVAQAAMIARLLNAPLLCAQRGCVALRWCKALKDQKIAGETGVGGLFSTGFCTDFVSIRSRACGMLP
jgi:hypothetical protein